ncbi:energy-coupling factor transporter ATPase [uncultured Dialister sp.]|uniref:energy-coupling factor transporter ATPase n=1 Tax=uncultured Dialister sp. TaxID=278064 RepID=UPI002657BC74|nr:energy-coupling factor transporter ATPase [uncultured Dialister sp.]
MSICVENVSCVYSKGSPFEKVALENINLTIEKGEFIGIIGHTGSGKSTLIQHLNGLIHPTSGKVTIDGVDLAAKTKAAVAKRHSVGMVFQYPEHQLFEETVAKDIAFGPKNLGCSEEETEKRVKSAMKFAGLDYDTFGGRSPFRLSGGQQRRVAIAGVIAMHPDFLILDEPSAGLDPIGRREIFSRIQSWYQKGVFSVILVSHNMDDIARLATRLLVMHKGHLVMDGKPMDIFLHHRRELQECGVDAPPLTQTLLYLKEKGIPVPEDSKTVEEAVDRMSQMLGGGKSC